MRDGSSLENVSELRSQIMLMCKRIRITDTRAIRSHTTVTDLSQDSANGLGFISVDPDTSFGLQAMSLQYYLVTEE